MTIRTKNIIINVSALVFMLTAVLGAATPYLVNGFRRVENDEVTDLAHRAVAAVDNASASLATKEYDWSTWDDVYQFVQDKNQTFITSNFNDEDNFKTPVFDIIMFYNRQGKLVYHNGGDNPPQALTDILLPGSPLLKYGSQASPSADTAIVSGVLAVQDKIMLVSARPILHTDATGPAQGTLIFAKYLGASEKAKLDASISPLLNLYPIDAPGQPADVQTAAHNLEAGQYWVNVLNSNYIGGYSVLNDIVGRPALVARVQAPRNVNKVAIASIKAYAWAVVSIGILFAIIRFALIDRVVIRRLTHFTKRVTKIKNETDARIVIDGNDEVTELGLAINNMLDRLSASRARINELLKESRHYQKELQRENKDIEKLVAERTLQLEEETSLFSASINSLPLGFLITDVNFNVMKINPQINDMLTEHESASSNGVARHPFMMAVTELLRKPGDKHAVRSHEYETDKGRFLHLVAAPILTKRQGIKGYVVVVEDVTEKKIAERSKDEFFSIASHELRTPLTAIRGNSSMMLNFYKDELEKSDMKPMLDDIYISSVRLIEIVNDFLDVSRIEQGKMKFELQDFAIEDVVDEVIGEMKTVVEAKKLSLSFEEPSEKLPLIHADHDRIKQVLYNLIGNALKFTEQGGVTITTKLEGRHLKVIVSDTGKGISPAGRHLLFHKFQQAGNSIYTRDSTRGTGLGLYISKLIVEHFGGVIRLENTEEGKGSSFSFTIPVKKSAK